MGAWGQGTFENDDALDWMSELEDMQDLSLVEEALDASDAEYLEAQEGCQILAASEIVLGLIGSARSGLPESAAEWIHNHRSLDATHLKAKAISALSALLSENSELKELWEESEAENEAWRLNIRQLQGALESV